MAWRLRRRVRTCPGTPWRGLHPVSTSTTSTQPRSFPPVVVQVKASGALFTRPEMRVERVTYPVMTPSAAVGVLESIFWKPEFRVGAGHDRGAPADPPVLVAPQRDP
ncbi:CRISPR-associated protein Cas5 [Dactylosporangium maewongense]|uniref:CRISPR-associated protein Cas5 n=1 Tax=Dactylosporangium maewongense TaxID=634393 RepID=UPI0031D0771A